MGRIHSCHLRSNSYICPPVLFFARLSFFSSAKRIAQRSAPLKIQANSEGPHSGVCLLSLVIEHTNSSSIIYPMFTPTRMAFIPTYLSLYLVWGLERGAYFSHICYRIASWHAWRNLPSIKADIATDITRNLNSRCRGSCQQGMSILMGPVVRGSRTLPPTRVPWPSLIPMIRDRNQCVPICTQTRPRSSQGLDVNRPFSSCASPAAGETSEMVGVYETPAQAGVVSSNRHI